MRTVSGSFYINLRNIMEEKQITIEKLSELSSINPTTLYMYWTNDKLPTINHLAAIAYALDCELTDLLPSSLLNFFYPDDKQCVEINDNIPNKTVLDNFDIHKFIDECMAKKDRSVSIYFGEHGTTISVYPITDDED